MVVQVRLKVSTKPGRSMLDSMSWQVMVQVSSFGQRTVAMVPTKRHTVSVSPKCMSSTRRPISAEGGILRNG
ncbi:hypothetical protein D9M71_832140 [compost metagenome]